MKLIASAFLLLLAFSHPLAAQEPAAKAAPQPMKHQKISFSGADEVYPKELQVLGVQGLVELLVTVGTDGKAKEVTVFKTSRSKALDDAAVAATAKFAFGLTEAVKNGTLPPFVIPVEFSRDSVDSLAGKTCQEFNVDVDYLRKTFPESKPEEMQVVKMTGGIFVIREMQKLTGDAKAFTAYTRRMAAASRGIAEACAAAPEAKFIQTYRALLEKAPA